MTVPKIILSILLFQLFLVDIQAGVREHWQKPEYIQESFIEIALKNEYSTLAKGVSKWTSVINYHFIHRVADQALHERLTKMQLVHLANITGITFNEVNHKKNANLLIIFSTENRLEQELFYEFNIKSLKQRQFLFRNSVCLAHYSTHKNGGIKKAIVIIPVDRARAHAKLISCIVEELTQVMGLSNDSDKVFPSVFNDKSYNELLTGLDYVLLKILYHPKVKAGASKNELKPVLKEIIKSMEKQGVIANARKQVMKGGLYPLLQYKCIDCDKK